MPNTGTSRAIKQDRAVRTRKDILDSAIQLFARRGILATTMAELARAIHMTPGALYWHFPTKEDLLLAAIAELHGRFVTHFEAAMRREAGKAPPVKLHVFAELMVTFLDQHREHGIFYALVGTEAAENNERVAEAVRQSLSLYIDAVEGILRKGQQVTGDFRMDIDPKAAAAALIHANLGVVSQQNLFRFTQAWAPLARALNTAFIDGLLKR